MIDDAKSIILIVRKT